MKELWKILLSILLTLLGVGLILLVSAPPRGQPIQLEQPPSPAPVIVHITGAVQQPGVYHLPAGSRVEDAVLAASGFLAEADQQALNLAATIVDGSQINIPYIPTFALTAQFTQAASGDPIPTEATPTPVETPTPKPVFPIDINSASQLELELLPQIGPVRAARIVAYRQSNGPFERIEDLRNVYDISPEVYAAIRDLIVASAPPALSPTPAATAN